MSVKAPLATVEALKLRKLIRLVVSLLHAGRFRPDAACRNRLHEGLHWVGTTRGMPTRDRDASVLQIILKAISYSATSASWMRFDCSCWKPFLRNCTDLDLQFETSTQLPLHLPLYLGSLAWASTRRTDQFNTVGLARYHSPEQIKLNNHVCCKSPEVSFNH